MAPVIDQTKPVRERDEAGIAAEPRKSRTKKDVGVTHDIFGWCLGYPLEKVIRPIEFPERLDRERKHPAISLLLRIAQTGDQLVDIGGRRIRTSVEIQVQDWRAERRVRPRELRI